MQAPGGWDVGVRVCAGVFAGVLLVSPGVARSQDTPNTEQLVRGRCSSCHEYRVVEVQALDEAQWQDLIDTHLSLGLEMSPEEIPPVVDYLFRYHGPLPEAPGREVLLNVCTMCHDLTRVKLHSGTPEEWQDTLIAMLNEGAPLDEDSFIAVLRYLATYFR